MCANIRSDPNRFDSYMLRELKQASDELSLKNISQPRIYDVATCTAHGRIACTTFKQAVSTDTILQIRHGPALVLCGTRWLVTDQIIGESLLDPLILEALGHYARKTLAVAAEVHAGVVEVATVFGTDTNSGTHWKISREVKGLYHADGGADDEYLDNNNGWLELGP